MPRLTCYTIGRRDPAAALIAICLVACLYLLAPTHTSAQGKSSNRKTPLVQAVESCQGAVVNIRGRKSVAQADEFNLTSKVMKQVNGMGTGVIIDPRGYILTNYHVVQDVRQIKVTTNKNETSVAQLIAFDEDTDLAIIRINTKRSLPVIKIGTSRDLMLGETVVAIGNAYGYEHTITRGVISQVNRKVQVSETQIYNDLIQTDASINPGNSGGPLINLDGEMIGINVAVRVNAQGIAFAIPVDSVMDIASRLLAKIVSNDVYAGLKTKTIFKSNQPLTVVETVDPESPAALSGIRIGDEIRSIAGRNCSRSVDFQRAMLDRRPGQQLQVVAVSSGQSRNVQIKLNAPKLSEQGLIWQSMGLRLAPVDGKMMRHLSVGFEHGLKVVQVRIGSPADRSNITAGDILVAMDGWKTESIDNVVYILNQKHIQESKPFEYYIFRGKQPLKGSFAIKTSRKSNRVRKFDP